MTVTHGTPGTSIRNALSREKRRVHARERHHVVERSNAIRDPERYAQVIAENEAIKRANPVSPERIAVHRAIGVRGKRSRKAVSVPPMSWEENETAARTAAEDRAIEVVRGAVEALSFQLEELSQAPNPKGQYENRIYQKLFFDAVQRLARCVKPHIQTSFTLPVTKERVALAGSHVCVNCGGPGRTQIRGYWYCDICEEAA